MANGAVRESVMLHTDGASFACLLHGLKAITADPVLGVEMASTVKVACFGYDKYEVYLKALILTGIVPPKKNILFSIGSYKEKLEILPLVQKLSAAGYNIFATSGTSNFLTEHGVHPRAVGMVSLMRWRTLRLEMEAGLMVALLTMKANPSFQNISIFIKHI
uniref:MGS-like domain-containing protein n=1 Tax=Psilocybe cubensis TaxID=181762 RepID=A0A8H7XND6_PSICU